MKYHKKITYFRELFLYWAGKYNVNSSIKIKEDNHDIAGVCCEENTLYYNPEEIVRLSKNELLELALHELGHLINNTTYDTKEEQINSEYFAEQFAINIIKEHYKDKLNITLNKLIKVIKQKTNENNDIYQQAYLKLPEIQELIKKENI